MLIVFGVLLGNSVYYGTISFTTFAGEYELFPLVLYFIFGLLVDVFIVLLIYSFVYVFKERKTPHLSIIGCILLGMSYGFFNNIIQFLSDKYFCLDGWTYLPSAGIIFVFLCLVFNFVSQHWSKSQKR